MSLIVYKFVQLQILFLQEQNRMSRYSQIRKCRREVNIKVRFSRNIRKFRYNQTEMLTSTLYNTMIVIRRIQCRGIK